MALTVPDIRFGPMIDQCKELKEENTEVFGFTGGATVDARNDTFEYLTENVQDVEVRHLMEVQSPQEIYCIKGITC